MCTNIVHRTTVDGSGKGHQGWFRLDQAYVSYDHPFHANIEHALNIDFVNEAAGVDSRVAVELTLDSARSLAAALLAAIEAAEQYEGDRD